MKKLFNFLLFAFFALTSIAQTSDKQDVTIKYTPLDALVMVDGDMVDSQDGLANISLSVGEHSYSIVAKGYYQQNGAIVVKKDKPCNVVVELLPKENTKPQSTVKPKTIATNNNTGVTTSATVMSNPEMTFQNLINNPMGFIVCDGNKWTMTPDILHEALKKSKMECIHTSLPGMENTHTLNQIKKTYRGYKVRGCVCADNDSFDEYYVGLTLATEKNANEFIKNILEDFNAAGINVEQAAANDFRSNAAKTSYEQYAKAFQLTVECLQLYHAEDGNNRYELFHTNIKGALGGKGHSCALIVLRK